MTASVLFQGAGRFSAEEFVRFWDALWSAVWAPMGDDRGALAAETEYESVVEVAKGVLFRRAALTVLRDKEWRPTGVEFLSGYCTAAIPVSEIGDVAVQVIWTETGAGQARLTVHVELAWGAATVKGNLVYRVRARRVVRERVSATLQEHLQAVADVA